MSLTGRELARKLLHIVVGGFAFLLRELTWPQAAALAGGSLLFNWLVLPRLGGRRIWRDAEHSSGRPAGILIYPLSVLALVLVFRHELWKAAAVWGVLALGDGLASIVGQALRGPRLPWNPQKSWSGLVAMLLGGTAGAAILIAWTLRVPMDVRIVALGLGVALACTWVESLATTLDDNLTVPLISAWSPSMNSRTPRTR
jgi:dolichol kinase